MRNPLDAVSGLLVPSDLVAARSHFDQKTLKTVGKMVARGEVAPDVPRAQLALAQARLIRRMLTFGQPWVGRFFVLVVLFWAGTFVSAVVRGDVGFDDVLSGALAAWGVYLLAVGPRQRAAAQRAEEGNRRFLEEQGAPLVILAASTAPPAASRWRAAGRTAATFVFLTVSFGAAVSSSEPGGLSVAGVLGYGLPFGTLMTLVLEAAIRPRGRSSRARRQRDAGR